MSNVIKVNIYDKDVLGFDEARKAAVEIAKERLGGEAILWSWNDKIRGRHSPPVECCGDECNPAWEVYAKARGGNLKVLVNDEMYEFIFGAPAW